MAAQQSGLESFLNAGSDSGGTSAPESTPAAPVAEKAENTSATAAPAEANKEASDFDPKDPAEQTPQQRAGLRRALEAEREKRQERERKLAELEGQLSVYQKSQVKSQGEQPAVDEYDQFLEGPKYIKGVLESGVAPIKEELHALKMQMSEGLTRSQHTDYDDVVSPFIEAAKGNPRLMAAFQAQVAATPEAMINPAKFAYEYAKSYREVSEVGSITELKTKLEKKIREELEAEYRKKGALAAAEQASTSSAAARGSGTTSPVVSGEQSIKDILAGR